MASSPRYVAVGAIVAGASGYAVILVAARLLGPAAYVEFSVFWAALYVLIGFLFGIQQEVTRSLRAETLRSKHHPPPQTSGIRPPLVIVTATLGAAGGAVAVMTTPFWAPSALGDQWPAFALMLAIAAILAAVQFTITGALGSLGAWRAFSEVVSAEALTRLAAFLVTAWLIGGVEAMAWATVLAFAASWLWLLRANSTRELLWRPVNEPLPATLSRFGQAMVAAGASGILINGFPALVTALSPTAEASRLGVLILLVTLTRAPLMVPLTAFASVLVAHFVDRRGVSRALVRPLTLVTIAGIGAAGLAALIGPSLLPIIFGDQYTASALTFAALTAASTGLAALTLTGAATLAADRHTAYVTGWLVAVAASIVVLIVAPFDLEGTVVLALLVGPALGMVLHFWALRAHLRRD